jgi:hypothetical protein
MVGMRLAIGQTWVSPKGLAYEIVGYQDGIFRVDVRDRDDLVVGSGPWLFPERKLRGAIRAYKLRLHDPRPKLDQLAERLDRKGHEALASALDQIGDQYIEARLPSEVKRDRVRRAEQDLRMLRDELEETTDPDEREALLVDIHDAETIMREEGPRVSKPNVVTPKTKATDERISEPNVLPK